MTSKLTREKAQWLHDACEEAAAAGIKLTMNPNELLMFTSYALAAMDGEPHTDDELSNLLWYSQEATCHSDPNYYCEFQRLATPGLIAGIILELQERRKADSEPVAITDSMAYAFHHALTDGPLGDDEVEEIKSGLRAAFASVTATQPAPERAHKWSYGLVHPENCQCIECRSARINGVKP
ncbi:TPA: hypothetical protein ACYU77_002975 [Klebsiella variicola subsp. variicola]